MVNFSFGSAVRILPLLAAMLGGMATAGPAVAHPHVWIDLKTEAHIDGEGRFAALTIVWIFDQFYSAFALDGLEKPGGAYKPEDLAALTDVNMTNLEEWNYFAEVTRGGETAKFGKPRDAHSAWDEKSGRLTLTFTLPLEEPQLASRSTMSKRIRCGWSARRRIVAPPGLKRRMSRMSGRRCLRRPLPAARRNSAKCSPQPRH